MFVISKDALIVIGIFLAMGVVALALLLAGPKGGAVAVAPAAPTAPTQTTASPPPPTTATAATQAPPAAAAVVAPPTTVASSSGIPAAQPVSAATAPAPTSTYVQPVQAAWTSKTTPPVPPVVAVDGVIYDGEYAHSTEAGGFQIHWSNDASFLRVGVISPGTGYLAIGFDPDDKMQGANFVLAAVRDGQLWTRDDYGYGPLAHASDVSLGGTDNILAAAGREGEGKTYVEFVIALNSGDPMDKVLVPGTTYDIVIAFHETSDDFDTYHSRRGAGKMKLDPA